jgi:hypothetical protein
MTPEYIAALQTPPTEIEISEVVSILKAGDPKFALVVSRLAYQRDGLLKRLEKQNEARHETT